MASPDIILEILHDMITLENVAVIFTVLFVYFLPTVLKRPEVYEYDPERDEYVIPLVTLLAIVVSTAVISTVLSIVFLGTLTVAATVLVYFPLIGFIVLGGLLSIVLLRKYGDTPVLRKQPDKEEQ